MKRIALALGLFVGGGILAAMAQTFAPNMPIIGGSSYCQSTVNGVCVSTIPAGPALTGTETIPVDTNYASGAGPQSAKIGMASIGAGTFQYVVPVTTDTVTALYTDRQVIVNPAGTIAAMTFVTPASTNLVNGQRLGLCTTQIVSTLTTTAGSGTTVSNAPTALLVPVATGAGSCVEWIYRQANTTWYRTQ